MSLFTPISGILGGSLIGISAATLLLFNGNILGAAGISCSFFLSPKQTFFDLKERWKIVFMASFFVTAKAITLFKHSDTFVDPRVGFDPNLPVVSGLGHIVAGFLVGFGTRLGNGCTTGHGICGLARFSKRSIAAVAAFMATGIISATICSPTCPLAKILRADNDSIKYGLPTSTTEFVGSAVTALAVAAAIPAFLRPLSKAGHSKKDETADENVNNSRKMVPAAVSGMIFALGLAISQMTLSSKIYGFLDMTGFNRGTYDATLITVMGGGFLVSWISYQFVKGFNVIKNDTALSCPLALKKSCGKFNVPSSKVIDSQLVIGEALFGLGWGIGGICPGPAMFLAAAGFPHLLFRWWPSFLVGSFLAQKIKERANKN